MFGFTMVCLFCVSELWRHFFSRQILLYGATSREISGNELNPVCTLGCKN